MFINRANELPLMVATLRGAYGRHVGEPAWEDFINRLLGLSKEFARMWHSGDVAPPGSRIKLVRHASVGDLRLISTSLVIQGAPESRVVVYTPSDEQSRTLLDRLRAMDDLLVGCPRHARHVSEILAERAAAAEMEAEAEAETEAETKDPASL
ncbi:transcriptional regulator, partial [Streptomyces sp. MCAF7]